MIKCQLCNKEFSQITTSHLKNSHQISFAEYRNLFPDVEVVSEELRDKIRQKNSGKPKTEEHKRKLSKSIRQGFSDGRKIHNKGLKGKWRKMSNEERKTRSISAQNRPPMTEETKRKIGSKSKRRKKSPEQIEKWKKSYKKFLEENNGSPLKGMKHSNKFKEKMKVIAKNRDPRLIQEKVEQMHKARLGQKESIEQRKRKSEARLKFMSENPNKIWNTKPEIEFKKLLEQNDIKFIQQYRINEVGHPYDFYLPEYNLIIEIDPPQHWSHAIWGTSGKSSEEKQLIFENQLEQDAIENYIAWSNDYKIARILTGTSYNGQISHGSYQQQLKLQGFDIEMGKN